jgi:alanine-glyoxylate transaminase / serine-glyoxylate transaminase / serine-pyruvate transaminase
VASEEIQMDDWGIDVVMSASQKGLGTPPGLSILLASQKALKVYESRKSPVTSYYASWKKYIFMPWLLHLCNLPFRWLPIMRAYEAGTAAYFATPPVNLIYAFHQSLTQITSSSPSLQERFQLHREASRKVKQAMQDLGLEQLPTDSSHAANGMTAVSLSFRIITCSDLIHQRRT